jgi:hypothetical protein
MCSPPINLDFSWLKPHIGRATMEFDLACCVAVGDVLYVGTNDAQVLRVSAAGEIEQLRGFDEVAGRDKWYAGSAVIDGKPAGPLLGSVP